MWLRSLLHILLQTSQPSFSLFCYANTDLLFLVTKIWLFLKISFCFLLSQLLYSFSLMETKIPNIFYCCLPNLRFRKGKVWRYSAMFLYRNLTFTMMIICSFKRQPNSFFKWEKTLPCSFSCYFGYLHFNSF